MEISRLIVWFAIASFAGWVFESAYNVIKTGHWEKRGFLFAPLCPIYGVGFVAALILFDCAPVASGEFPLWGVFLVSMAGSAVMEYVVSVVLEKLFGTVWWDYSNMPLNLNGRICLPASLLFGAAGVAVTVVAIPAVHTVHLAVPDEAFELLALAFVFGLGADVATTVLSLSDLMDKIQQVDESLNGGIDERLQLTAGAIQAIPERLQAGGAEAVARVHDGRVAGVEMVKGTAARLTKRQVRLLSQLRRFTSQSTREKVETLRGIIGSATTDAGQDDNDG